MNENMRNIQRALAMIRDLMNEEMAETIIRIGASGNVQVTQTKKIRFHLED